MAVENGSPVEATYTNSKLLSRTQNTTAAGTIGLLNPDSPSIIQTQRELNSLASFLGKAINTAADALPSWASNNAGLSTDNVYQRAGGLDAKFDSGTGHAHSGDDGDGVPIDASNLVNVNNYWCVSVGLNVTGAEGTSDDVSSLFTGKTPGGGSSTPGVLTDAPENMVYLVDSSTKTFLEDAEGQRVYGRITESAGVWTLSYFTNEAGVETAYSIPSPTDITIIYREVFDQADRPTLPANVLDFGSLDLTSDVVDASTSHRGLVSTGTQSFAGNKTFTGTITASNLSGTNTGDVTLAAFGSSPNANGASLAGQVLALQPASDTQPGGVSTAAQTFAGAKTFAGDLEAQAKFILDSVNNASTGADITISTPSKAIVKMTGAVTSIAGIGNPSTDLLLVLVNKSGGTYTLKNNSGAASAGDKIYTGTGADVEVLDNAAMFLFYDLTDGYWTVIGGTGSGSGGSSLDGNQDRALTLLGDGGTRDYSAGGSGVQLDNSIVFGNNAGLSFGAVDNNWAGANFLPASTFQCTQMDIKLFLNSTTGSFNVLLVGVTGVNNEPDETNVLATSNTISNASLGSGQQTAVVTFSSPPTLNSGTRYAFIIKPVVNFGGLNNILRHGNTDTRGGDSSFASTDSGTSWGSPNANDPSVIFYGTGDPELSWTDDVYVLVPGCAPGRNTIPADTIVVSDGQAAWVKINRTAGADDDLDITVENIEDIDMSSPEGDDKVIFARAFDGRIIWGIDRDDGIAGEESVADDAITAIKIAVNAVTEAKILNGAVSEAKLASASVSTGKLKADLISAATALTTPDDDDAVLISDTSASALKKINISDLKKLRFSTVTTTYTVLANVDVVLADAAGGGFTVTLPSAAANAGRKITVIKINTGFANVITISGALLANKIVRQYGQQSYISDGTNWYHSPGELMMMAIATSNNGQNAFTSSVERIEMEDVVYDPFGMYNAATGTFTAPAAGMGALGFFLTSQGQDLETAGDEWMIRLFKNGSGEARIFFDEVDDPNSDRTLDARGHFVAPMASGETWDIRGEVSDATTALTTNTGDNRIWFQFWPG